MMVFLGFTILRFYYEHLIRAFERRMLYDQTDREFGTGWMA